MISQLSMSKIACFKDTPAVLSTNKRVNLIYGLNGAGKSTISNYLRDRDHGDFSHCSTECGGDEIINVYNQQFIEDTFFEDLPGIFTLSEENKTAQTAIKNATNEIGKLEIDRKDKDDLLKTLEEDITDRKEKAKTKCWEIKENYSGPDRVLDFCLEGLKGSKDSLFNHIDEITKPTEKPKKTIEELQNEIRRIGSGSESRLNLLSSITFLGGAIETEEIFRKIVVGSKDSPVADLIEKLNNSDWVKQGLDFLPDELGDKNEKCPFCQNATISAGLIENVKKYFDETYEKESAKISKNLEDYTSYVEAFRQIPNYSSHEMLSDKKAAFEAKRAELNDKFSTNIQSIQIKVKNPSLSVSLASTSDLVAELNELIAEANSAVTAHNEKIDNLTETKEKARKEFWEIMRWDYDQTLENLAGETTYAETKRAELKNDVEKLNDKINIQKDIISEKQRETINVDKAIDQINAGLIDLGIDDFQIVKADRQEKEGDFYKLVRGETDENVFKSLSEGERMIISFLYFLEKCRGKSSVTDTATKKIVVIDDPISSLSHIYVFNIGRMIHKEFLRSEKYEQIFVLTHSLYFFYELVNRKDNERRETQNLFRLVKYPTGSQIAELGYSEIQNEYQGYWAVIKDDKLPPALIANCMRNIIEYFFGFVEKSDLNVVFQKPQLSAPRFGAFNRYISRESHSEAVNILDTKEFNYEDFREGLRLVFELCGYSDHYKKMSKDHI